MKAEELQAIADALKQAVAPLLDQLNEIRKQVTKEPDWTPNYKSVDVVGGVGKVEVRNVGGKYFLCASATAPFDIQFDDGERFTCVGGLFVPLAPQGFKRVAIFNLTTDPLTVAFYASNTPLSYSGLIGG